MSGPSFLGLDASPHKIGWGAVADRSGRAILCGATSHDGSPEEVRAILGEIDAELAGRSYEVSLIYMERAAFSGGLDASFRAGDAFGVVRALARVRWPWAPIYPVQPAQWRKSVGVWGKGRDALKRQALLVAGIRKFDHQGSDDAAEGALIACAAWEDGRAGRVWTREEAENG
jgi:hypothetical protein